MKSLNFPRNALIWLLVAITCVYLPLQLQLPIWTAGVFLFVLIWRWMMHLGRWPYPNKVAKVAVVTLGIGAVLISAQGKFHLESATAFILVAGLLKVLEIKTQRDGYIVLFLSFFLIAVNFLFEQGILTALYSIISIWVLISALIALHQTSFSEQNSRYLIKDASKTAVQVLLLSLPIMLVMFILFPRFGPLWSLNLQSDKAKAGLSEQMSPGDIAELSNSDELVFRVEFSGNQPSNDNWYWRALILDQYQLKGGRALWNNSGKLDQVSWYPKSWQPDQLKGAFDYKIIQEPTRLNWLLSLRGVSAIESGIGMTEDDRIVSKRKLHQRKEYQVRSWPDMTIAKQGLRGFVRQQNLQLDQESNSKSRALAQKIRLENKTDTERVEAALQYYRQQKFSYTLKPERMSRDDIDDFLFNKRAGFCSHYSSSFVFLMRSMGIPARVVAGYQGGELNEDSGHITVRQYDAHAWVEVWLEGIGWKSYDPTAQVAPDRISQGLRNALKNQDEFLSDTGFSLLKLSGFGVFNELRLKLDEFNYYWHQSVLNFNKNRQASKLKEWFGKNFLKNSLYWLAGLFCGFFFLLTLMVLWQKPKAKKDAIDRALDKFNRKLMKQAMQREDNEGLEDYSCRLQESYPQHAKSIDRLMQQLQGYYYSQQVINGKDLARQISQLANKLAKVD
jgi:NADH:ubiquinone oxidoreductase subunit 6 (subunit J)